MNTQIKVDYNNQTLFPETYYVSILLLHYNHSSAFLMDKLGLGK